MPLPLPYYWFIHFTLIFNVVLISIMGLSWAYLFNCLNLGSNHPIFIPVHYFAYFMKFLLQFMFCSLISSSYWSDLILSFFQFPNS